MRMTIIGDGRPRSRYLPTGIDLQTHNFQPLLCIKSNWASTRRRERTQGSAHEIRHQTFDRSQRPRPACRLKTNSGKACARSPTQKSKVSAMVQRIDRSAPTATRRRPFVSTSSIIFVSGWPARASAGTAPAWASTATYDADRRTPLYRGRHAWRRRHLGIAAGHR